MHTSVAVDKHVRLASTYSLEAYWSRILIFLLLPYHVRILFFYYFSLALLGKVVDVMKLYDFVRTMLRIAVAIGFSRFLIYYPWSLAILITLSWILSFFLSSYKVIWFSYLLQYSRPLDFRKILRKTHCNSIISSKRPRIRKNITIWNVAIVKIGAANKHFSGEVQLIMKKENRFTYWKQKINKLHEEKVFYTLLHPIENHRWDSSWVWS